MKTFNGGTWTQGRFDTFIKGALRAAHKKWGPKNACIKDARLRRGFYLCDGCGKVVPATVVVELKTKPGVMKRVKNIYADHIAPVVDPHVGRGDWQEVVDRMFVEREGYQALCHSCHTYVTAEERAIATERKRKERETDVSTS
jgi:hypothetical protein